jgi:hypothetical protein
MSSAVKRTTVNLLATCAWSVDGRRARALVPTGPEHPIQPLHDCSSSHHHQPHSSSQQMTG